MRPYLHVYGAYACMMVDMSLTLPLPSHLEIIASLAQWHASAANERLEFVFSINDGVLNGPFFYDGLGTQLVEVAPALDSFVSLLTKTLTQQLSEGLLPDSYFVRVVATGREPVRVVEVDSTRFLTGSELVLDADFVSGAVVAGRSAAPSVSVGAGKNLAVRPDSPVRYDALLLRKLLLERGHGAGYSVPELDAEQQRRGVQFPPELRFYYALVREGEVARVDGRPVFAAALDAGTGAEGNVIDDALRAGSAPLPALPVASESDMVRPVFTAREWIVFAQTNEGDQFAFDMLPGPAGNVGQVVEFTAGELTPPRVVARSLTEFVNGEFVSAQERALSWVGAGDGADASAAAESLAPVVAVFDGASLPTAEVLAQCALAEVKQLDGAFDFASLSSSNNLKELCFTWNGDYKIENAELAAALPLERLTAPISVWSALLAAQALPQQLNSAQFIDAEALSTQDADIINAVLEHYKVEPLSLNTWQADVAQSPFVQESADEADLVPDEAASAASSRPEIAEVLSAEDSSESGFRFQTSEISPATAPTPILQQPHADAAPHSPIIDIVEGGEEWTTPDAIATQEDGYLDEEELPNITAPSKGAFEAAQAEVEEYYSPTSASSEDSDEQDYNALTLDESFPETEGSAEQIATEDQAAREALAHLQELVHSYEEAAQKAATMQPKDEYLDQAQTAPHSDASSQDAELATDEPLVIEEQEVIEDNYGHPIEAIEEETETASAQEAGASVDQHMGERPGSDDGGFRAALKRWFG